MSCSAADLRRIAQFIDDAEQAGATVEAITGFDGTHVDLTVDITGVDPIDNPEPATHAREDESDDAPPADDASETDTSDSLIGVGCNGEGELLEHRVENALDEHGELSRRDLELELECSNSHLANVLSELQDEARVVARQDPEDRRRHLYRLPDQEVPSASDGDSTDDDADDASEYGPIAIDGVEYQPGHTSCPDVEAYVAQAVADGTTTFTPSDVEPHVDTNAVWVSRSLKQLADAGTILEVDVVDTRPREPTVYEVTVDLSASTADTQATPADGEADEADEAGPKTCGDCGAEIEGGIEFAVHRLEEHGAKQYSRLGDLDPGEFEGLVEDASSTIELADTLDWSHTKTCRMLGVYGLTDAVGTGDGTLADVDTFQFDGVQTTTDEGSEPSEPKEAKADGGTTTAPDTADFVSCANTATPTSAADARKLKGGSHIVHGVEVPDEFSEADVDEVLASADDIQQVADQLGIMSASARTLARRTDDYERLAGEVNDE